MFKFLLGFVFVQPPDFHDDVEREIRDGPQARLCAKMTPEQRDDYVREQAMWRAVLWACKNTGWANTFSRINFVVLLLACIFSSPMRSSVVAAGTAITQVFRFFSGG